MILSRACRNRTIIPPCQREPERTCRSRITSSTSRSACRRLTWLPLPADPSEDERTFEEACWAYPAGRRRDRRGRGRSPGSRPKTLGLAHGVAAVVALAASFAVTGAEPERALARAAGSLIAPRGADDAPGAERTLIALALVVLFRATAIAAAAGTGAVGGVLIGAAAIAYACQLAALHGAPEDEAETEAEAAHWARRRRARHRGGDLASRVAPGVARGRDRRRRRDRRHRPRRAAARVRPPPHGRCRRCWRSPKSSLCSPSSRPGDGDREGIDHRDFLEPVEAAGGAAVSCLHVGVEQDRRCPRS